MKLAVCTSQIIYTLQYLSSTEHYKPEGGEFDSPCGSVQIFIDVILMVLGSTQPLTNEDQEYLLGGGGSLKGIALPSLLKPQNGNP